MDWECFRGGGNGVWAMMDFPVRGSPEKRRDKSGNAYLDGDGEALARTLYCFLD